MNKRGAVELSMTTIIIIVIGITILSLGLVWIRSTFKQVGGLTQEAFERGQAEISEIFGESDEPIALSPSETELEQGGTMVATLIVNNLGAASAVVQADVESRGGGDIVCAFADTFESISDEYDLDSGEQMKLQVLVEDQSSALGTYGCRITVAGLEDGDQSTTLIVEIV